nr:uncharacterized protein LOC107406968 [Ziziphus jujuba var. spinosa]
MPKKFWAEDIYTSSYTQNRCFTKSIEGKTPYELWFGEKPYLKNVKVFGNVCFLHVHSNMRDKLDKKANVDVLVGYSEVTKGFRVYILETKKLVVIRDVKIDENAKWDWNKEEVKAEHQRPSSLLKPLMVPEWKWEKISMVFVVGLPKTLKGYNAIWVIVDRLTKFAQFLPIRTTFTMDQYAQLYVNEIVKLHEVLLSIISYHDPRFTSNFWRSLHKAMCTKLNFSTAFHPQTDGRSKRTIQTLEDMLRACVMDFTGSWDKHLPLVEFAYNNSYHTSIKMAPYEALYGRKCRSLFGKKGKLSLRFVGPFKILDRVGDLAYRLALPPALFGVHNVFHVSILRKYVHDPSHVVCFEPLQLNMDLTYEELSFRIVDQKEKELRTKKIPLVKVLWRNHSVEEAIWEREHEIHEKYPHLFDS